MEFFIELILPAAHYGPGVYPTSNRNEYQGYLFEGKGGRLSENSGSLNPIEPQRPV